MLISKDVNPLFSIVIDNIKIKTEAILFKSTFVFPFVIFKTIPVVNIKGTVPSPKISIDNAPFIGLDVDKA